MNTRERIAYESLKLFCVKGFTAVSVRDIAKAVGIKESSLYNHYKNKQDIFDCLIEENSKRAERIFCEVMPCYTEEEQAGILIDARVFSQMMTRIFEQYFEDEYLMMFYRLLTIEQYVNEKIRRIHDDFFFWNPLSSQEDIFRALMERGLMREADPRITAVQFFAPVCLLFDQSVGKSREEQKKMMKVVEAHVKQFYECYLEG